LGISDFGINGENFRFGPFGPSVEVTWNECRRANPKSEIRNKNAAGPVPH